LAFYCFCSRENTVLLSITLLDNFSEKMLTRSKTALRRRRIELMCDLVDREIVDLDESNWQANHLIPISMAMPAVHDSIGTTLAMLHTGVYRHSPMTSAELMDYLTSLQLQSDVMVNEVYEILYHYKANTIIRLMILYHIAKRLPRFTDRRCLDTLDRLDHFVPFLNLFKSELTFYTIYFMFKKRIYI